MQLYEQNVAQLNATVAEIRDLLEALPQMQLDRAKAEGRYEKQLGDTCVEFAGSMAANLVERKAKAACSSTLTERNQAQYQHEDARLAIRALMQLTSSSQTLVNKTEQAIDRIPGLGD